MAFYDRARDRAADANDPALAGPQMALQIAIMAASA